MTRSFGQMVRIFAAIAALAVVVVAHAQIDPVAAVERDVYAPKPEMARVLSLGHEALLADFYWLRAVQLVGGAAIPAESIERVGLFSEMATRLDPYIDHPYRFAAVWMTDTRENVLRANEILRRGIAYHPTDWRNRFYLSFNHFFYLSENEIAARELEPALELEGTPPYMANLHARLRSGAGGLEAAEAYLHELARNAPDGHHRAGYQKALDEIATERRARFLDAARAAYRERNGRDIESVEDLVRPPDGVLVSIPPEPQGWEWELDSYSGDIVSTYYRSRYRVNIHPTDRPRRAEWAKSSSAQQEQQDER